MEMRNPNPRTVTGVSSDEEGDSSNGNFKTMSIMEMMRNGRRTGGYLCPYGGEKGAAPS